MNNSLALGWSARFPVAAVRATLVLTLLAVTLASSTASPLRAQEPPSPTPPAKEEPAEKVVGKPRIHLPEVTFYWDSILQGTTLRKDFVIENHGDQLLRIDLIKTKCHCTTFEAEQEIPAGGRGIITLVFDSNKIKPGKTEKDAQIFSNDPDIPMAKIWFGGSIKSAFYANPRKPVLRGLLSNETTTELSLYPSTTLSFEIEEASSSYGLFAVERIDSIRAQKGHKLILKKLPSDKAEKKPDYLKLKLKMQDGTTIEPFVPVTVENLENVTIKPDANVFFQSRETNRLFDKTVEQLEKTIRVKALNASQPFKITGARIEGAPEGVFALEQKTIKEGSHYELIVILREYPEASYAEGKVIIETDDPSVPRHEVKLFAKFGRK